MFILFKKFNHNIYILFTYRFVLLKDPKYIPTKSSSFSGAAVNTATNEKLNITLQLDLNISDRNDNPFSYFPTALEAAYFWLTGDLGQGDEFDFWAVNAFILIASIFLVIILQNMLIAFMR